MTGNDALRLKIQQGLPLVPRPFDAIGEAVGLSCAEVLQTLETWRQKGRMRRFGAVFDSRRLGYSSTLCAMAVPEGELDAVVAPLRDYSGVTHCYARENPLNLWFTYTAPRGEMPRRLAQLQSRLGGRQIHNLPAVRRFKVNVIFGARTAASTQVERDIVDHAGLAESLTEGDRELVRALQGDVPLSRDFFGSVARSLGIEEQAMLVRLREWQQRGVLRRIGALLVHYEFGFSANGMCVWRVAPEAVETIGRRLAARAEVSHCYERRPLDCFPNNLYAMVHAQSAPEAQAICDTLSRDIVGGAALMLLSTREYIKRSTVFFLE